MSTLTSYFQHAGFSENEAAQIAENFTVKKLKKGSYFVEEGSKLLGFIETGFLQYYIDIDGKEKTTYSIGINIGKYKSLNNQYS